MSWRLATTRIGTSQRVDPTIYATVSSFDQYLLRIALHGQVDAKTRTTAIYPMCYQVGYARNKFPFGLRVALWVTTLDDIYSHELSRESKTLQRHAFSNEFDWFSVDAPVWRIVDL